MKTWADRLVVLPTLVLGGVALIAVPRWAPGVVLLGLATAVVPVVKAWRAAAGTALRAAVAWAGLAIALGMASQAAAWVEPLETGRPIAGHLVYLSVLATLAALTSVLNARAPGGVAWAILMALLVLVFLIPWLAGPGMARKAQGLNRLRLEAPWSVFYVLVVVAGVTNYLPTRYGRAAAWLGLGLAGEYVALTRSELRLAHGGSLWLFFPWTLSVSVWSARRRAARGSGAQNQLDATWLWFRDHWGVVWALRVEERFNRTADQLGWPLRLMWYGAVPVSRGPGGNGAVDGQTATIAELAEPTLRSLLRRFANEDRIARAASLPTSGTCLTGDDG